MGFKTFLKKTQKFRRLDKILILLVAFGIVLSGVSLLRGILLDSQVQVEVLGEDENTIKDSKERYFVDIEGAVMSPGVYVLPEGSRIKDALVLAGGLAAEADRSFCEKNLNMAELLTDGQKIYIPKQSIDAAGEGYTEAISVDKKISINTATAAELDTLWGIGEQRALTVVKNRPYQSIDDLVSKGVLPKSVVDKIRDSLSVY